MSSEEIKAMEEKAKETKLNDWPIREYPFRSTALPKGPDPVWQNFNGTDRGFETDALGVKLPIT